MTDSPSPDGQHSQTPLTCRGVRGAITTGENTREAILEATGELLGQMVAANDIRPADLASVTFTATPDLDAAYPAQAARQLGWTHVPLLCMQEMRVTGGLKLCIRVLLHWNTARQPRNIRHVYLREASILRPDLAGLD